MLVDTKWCGGKYKGKYSIVHTNKIQYVDIASYLDGQIDFSEEFAVEWGYGKLLKGGFPVFMATIKDSFR